MHAPPRTAALDRRLRAHRDRDRDRASRSAYERRLVELYHAQPDQREHVLECFRPFAMSFAQRLKRDHVAGEDLEQVAMLGLLKAFERFDPAVGTSFTAYAAPTILGELRRYYRDTGWAVHVPRAKQELALAIARTTRELERTGCDCRDAAVAEALGVPASEVAAGRLALRAIQTASTDQPLSTVDGDDGPTIASTHGELEAGYERVEQRSLIGELTRDLPARDRAILVLRFVDGLSQAEVGRRVGISQMQVSRELRRLIAELRARAAETLDRQDVELTPAVSVRARSGQR